MSQRWIRIALTAVLSIGVALQAQAQVLGTGILQVQEIGVQLYHSTVTAVQSTISAIEDVVQSAAALENLVPLDVIVTAEGIIEDMEELGKIMQQAERLQYDVLSLQRQLDALFHLDTVPSSTSELQMRLAEIRRMRQQSWSYVTRLQTLGRTAMRTVEHLSTLLKSISAFLGNKQAQQSIAQMNATMSKTLAIHAAQVAAYQQAGAFDKLEELVTIESLQRIQKEIMADWPRR